MSNTLNVLLWGHGINEKFSDCCQQEQQTIKAFKIIDHWHRNVLWKGIVGTLLRVIFVAFSRSVVWQLESY